MKAVLSFNLPEDQYEHRTALEGSRWRTVVFDTDQLLRAKLKYGHQYASVDEALEDIRKQLNDNIADLGLDLYAEG